MIPKVTVLAIFLGVSSQHTAYGAAYSKVYLQSGPGVIPVNYLNYGVPPVASNPQIAQLSAPPGGSVLPLPNIVSPCIAPCILPAQTGATVAAVQPNSKYTNYNTPSQPAIMAPSNDDKPSYEYSYVVYDEITGDRKAQRELSDGSVVQGEYSLIQPDGYVREVKYTADDLTGFNAVVQRFLPESVLGRDNKPDVKTTALLPCEDNKKEAIKAEPEADTLNNIQEPIHEEIQKTAHDEELPEPANVPAHDHIHYHVHDHEHDPGHDHFHDHAHDHYHGHAHDHFHDHAHEHYHEDELTPEHHHEHVHNETIELTVVPVVDVVPEVVASTTQTELEQVAIEQYEPTTELMKNPMAESITNKVQSPQATETHESLQTAKPVASIPNGLVSYNDIIKCLQAAIANNSNVLKPNISPLTYVILPGANKPC